ncbi:MAG: discoidin domain-containing protein, partial [Ginsengibacter sp.]
FEPYSFDNTSSRYVKIVCHGTNLHLWNAISEVELRGHEITDNSNPPPPLAKLPVYAVIGSADEDKVSNLIDGDKTTRWAATGNGNFIAADLGGLNNILQLKIAWFKGDERVTFFDVETSVDGTKWIKVYTGKSSGKTLDFETYTLTAGNARYARIIGHGTNIDRWNALNEIEFYGTIIQKRRAYTILPVKSVTASSDEGNGNIAANTIDKAFYTRWSVFGNGQTLTLDMGMPDTVKSLNIAWYRGYQRTMSFDVQTSIDKMSWATIYSGKSAGSAVFLESIIVPTTVAGFVRIVCHGSDLSLWNAINEIEVLGSLPATEFNKLQISSVSSLSADENIAANAIDSDLNTRWSAIGPGQAIQFTLKNPDTIKLVKIGWYKGDLRTANYLIQVSSDSLNWKTVFTGTSSGKTNNLQTVDIPDTALKYLRIVGLGNSMNTWNSISEVELWGNNAPLSSNSLLTTFAESEQFELSTGDKLSAKPHLPGKNSSIASITSFVLWPNPNKGLFSIKTDLSFWRGAELTIYNSTGKIMFNRKINQSATTVDLTKKSKGMYFIKVRKGSDELNSKIIIQ